MLHNSLFGNILYQGIHTDHRERESVSVSYVRLNSKMGFKVFQKTKKQRKATKAKMCFLQSSQEKPNKSGSLLSDRVVVGRFDKIQIWRCSRLHLALIIRNGKQQAKNQEKKTFLLLSVFFFFTVICSSRSTLKYSFQLS